MAYSNLRRNPIDSSLSTRAIVDESKTVAELFELPGAYGFNLDDRPIAGTVSIVTDNTAATPFTIVLTTPAPGQVFVDFNTQRGMCIFHADDTGTAVLCTYSGAGTNNTIENAQGVADAQIAAKKEASGGIAGLTLFKINFRNALNTFTSFFTNSNTAARTYTFQDANGTIAHTSDIPAFASQAEAEAGSNTTKAMNPLRTAQAIAAIGGAAVTSVFGRAGAVTAQTGDYAAFYAALKTYITAQATPSRVTGSAPTALGQYRSYLRNAGARTYTETNGTPAAAPSSTNGYKLYNGNAFASADTNSEPSRYEIYIGTGKTPVFEFYSATGRTGFICTSIFPNWAGTNEVGCATGYDPATGIAFVTIIQNGNQCAPGLDEKGVPIIADIYFDIKC